MDAFLATYLPIIVSTAVVYLFIVIALRVFGKTEIAQLSVTDLVFIMLLSNAVQNAMVGQNSTLSGGVAAAATLFVANFIFKQCLYFFPGFSRVIQGQSLMLIYKGKINERNLKSARLTHEELMESIREHGVRNVSEVDLAVLEVDGNISVLSKDFSRKTTNAMTKRRPPHRQTKKQD